MNQINNISGIYLKLKVVSGQMGMLFILILIIAGISCQRYQEVPIESDPARSWVDSTYNQLTLEQKVGQLFMVATYSNRGEDHKNDIAELIQKHHIGGLIFFQGGPVRQAHMTNDFQNLSELPLLIAIDGEWGLRMRLDSTIRYPYNMTLGAIQNDDLIKSIGREIGKHHKRLGIHVNFAPVIDVNTNPKNPVIGARSFGEDKFNVTRKGLAFMEGMQEEGVMACGKHFPGHGDTATDSHYTLPTIGFDKERIDSVELYPYYELIKNGLGSVMVAHLNVPSLEKEDGLPSSLSYSIITDLLKGNLAYEGIIFTDALNMKGASDFKSPGDIDLAAFIAGNDILLFSEDPVLGIQKIMHAVETGQIAEERLAYSVKKMLKAKYEAGLLDNRLVQLENLVPDLNSRESIDLNLKAIENAITRIKGVPGESLTKSSKIAYVPFGNGDSNTIGDVMKSLGIPVLSSDDPKLKEIENVIIGYHRSNYRLTHLIGQEEVEAIESLAKKHKSTLLSFASQYALAKMNFDVFETIFVCYENTSNAQKAMIKILSGKSEAIGKLPASINESYPVNSGL